MDVIEHDISTMLDSIQGIKVLHKGERKFSPVFSGHKIHQGLLFYPLSFHPYLPDPCSSPSVPLTSCSATPPPRRAPPLARSPRRRSGRTPASPLWRTPCLPPAAFRLVPLDLHPNRVSAERTVAAALAVEEEKKGRTSLLGAVSGHRYYKDSRSSRKWSPTYYSFSSLEHALKKLGERVGIESLSPHDLRRASITACLLAGVPPELIAKWHGHEDLPTTFEHYVFGLSAVQARDLGRFLSKEENQVWVAITDAVQLLGVTKVAVYKRYSPKNPG